MKRIVSRTLALVLLVALFTIIPTVVANAENHKLDSILVKVSDDQVVKVSVNEYMKALNLQDKSAVFRFLRGSESRPTIFGINSGEKYISTSNFMQALNKNNKDISKAIETATTIVDNELDEIKELTGMDEEGNPILEDIKSDPKKFILKNIQVDALDTSMSSFGIFSVSIKYANLEKIFPEINQDTIFILKLDDANAIELVYDSDANGFVNWDIQGYDEEMLLNAIVEISETQDPGEDPDTKPFQVINIY